MSTDDNQEAQSIHGESQEEVEALWSLNGVILWQTSFTFQIDNIDEFEAFIYGTEIPISFIPDDGHAVSRKVELFNRLRAWTRKLRRRSCQK